MATPMQQKLLKIIFENLGNTKSTMSKGEMLLKAGYSKSQSDNPQQIFSSLTIREATDEFTKQLDDKRRRAITYITDSKLEKSSARDLTYVVDTLNKAHQLLTGEDTERQGINLNIIKYENDNDTLPIQSEEVST